MILAALIFVVWAAICLAAKWGAAVLDDVPTVPRAYWHDGHVGYPPYPTRPSKENEEE